jgi:hypothetical protein
MGRSRVKPLFWLLPTLNLYESMFLGASPVEPFYLTPFGRKRLQMNHEAGGEALPNGALAVITLVRV